MKENNANGNSPAYPVEVVLENGEMVVQQTGPNSWRHFGLTKREMFAMAAMQGICAGPVNSHQLGAKLIAKGAIEIADELLKQLES